MSPVLVGRGMEFFSAKKWTASKASSCASVGAGRFGFRLFPLKPQSGYLEKLNITLAPLVKSNGVLIGGHLL